MKRGPTTEIYFEDHYKKHLISVVSTNKITAGADISALDCYY